MREAGVGGAPGEFFGEAVGVVVVGVGVGVIWGEVWVGVLMVLLDEGAVAGGEARVAVLVGASEADG